MEHEQAPEGGEPAAPPAPEPLRVVSSESWSSMDSAQPTPAPRKPKGVFPRIPRKRGPKTERDPAGLQVIEQTLDVGGWAPSRMRRRTPLSPEAYALAGYARELGISPKSQRYAELRILNPALGSNEVARMAGSKRPNGGNDYEKRPKVRQYLAALAHVASGRSMASFDTPTRIHETLGDAAELLELLWRRARFKLGDYENADGSINEAAVHAAPPGVFAGRDKQGRPMPTGVGEAQALLAKVLNLGHVNDASATVHLNQTILVQALGRMSEPALRELQAVLVPQSALPALQSPAPAIIEVQATPAPAEPPAPTQYPEEAPLG